MQIFRTELNQAIIKAADIKVLSDISVQISKEENLSQTLFNISANVEITDIDPAWIGYLFLMAHEHKNKGLIITLELLKNYEKGSRPDIVFKIKQYIVYGGISMQSPPFILTTANGVVQFPHDSFRENTFVLSGQFSVPLIVDRENEKHYQLIFLSSGKEFIESLDPNAEPELEWSANSEEFYRKINTLYRNRSRPDQTFNCLLNLGRIAFYRMLRKTWSLTVYLDPSRKNNPDSISQFCRAGELGSATKKGEINALEYFKLVEPVYKDISRKPLIYIFIFNMLLSREMLPDILNKENAQQFAEVLHKRWAFCKNLVHGLTELAKNIKEHSSSGFGIITSRIASIKTDRQEFEAKSYNEFLSFLPKEMITEDPGSILEMQVIDLGRSGIVSKLLKNLEDAITSVPLPAEILAVYNEDIDRIKCNSVKLAGLLEVDNQSPLNHQSKRCVAHLGLLIFTKLIVHNKGVLFATSNKLGEGRESACIPKDKILPFPELNTETLFRFLLPVREDAIYESPFSHPSDYPTEFSSEQVIGLESLMEYHVLPIHNGYEEKELFEKKVIFSYQPEAEIFATHPEEFQWWEKLKREFKKIDFAFKDPVKKIIHLDLKNLSLDPSQLFRFLGFWELQYSRNPLLISNVDQEVLAKLVVINEYYHDQNPFLPFWNKYAPVIVYSYVRDIMAPEKVFYFADALFGGKAEDFYLMNRVINTYHFNSVTWLKRLKEQNDPVISESDIVIVNDDVIAIGETISIDHPAFYRRHYLLPFDLLLFQEDGRNLFEINTGFLLQNDIQPIPTINEHTDK